METKTYTEAVIQHLDDLQTQQQTLGDLARGVIADCRLVDDEDGIKIAQIDLTLAQLCLEHIRLHKEQAVFEQARSMPQHRGSMPRPSGNRPRSPF